MIIGRNFIHALYFIRYDFSEAYINIGNEKIFRKDNPELVDGYTTEKRKELGLPYKQLFGIQEVVIKMIPIQSTQKKTVV